MNRSIDYYAPFFDEQKQQKEDKNLYLKRIHDLLPNFPDEVVLQWFYDHGRAINYEDYEWLDFESLKFEQIELKTDEIPTVNFGHVEAVENYRHQFFEGGNTYSQQIAESFIDSGTWPVPPIFLFNEDGKIKNPRNRPVGSPLHLIEGHHRLALFIGYKTLNKLAQKHFIFLAK